jgi:predicted hotdog family 3-hydroxylacyl-ACP dehydratase
MDLKDIPITSLIPQRPPFVMVDRVLTCEKAEAVTEFVVREDNIFLDDMVLAPAGIMENMTQSCAARMGCINREQKDSIKIGFIGNIRNCAIIRQPRCHETLHTYIEIVEEVLNLTRAHVTTKVGDDIIASAILTIALTDIKAS